MASWQAKQRDPLFDRNTQAALERRGKELAGAGLVVLGVIMLPPPAPSRRTRSTGRGVVVAIAQELGLPVVFIGTGEGLEDLESFEPQAFVEGVFGS